MLWQYTVTPRSCKWILRTEERGFSPKPSVGKHIFNAIVILYFLFLILVFSSYLLSSFRDGAFSLPFILENLAILLFLSAALYCFATKRNPPRFSKSEHILGLCCVCVKNGWFYFMRTFTNGEYYFRFFLPREAFSSCSAEEGQLALRKHLPFYMDRDTLQANLVILCFFCLCAAAGWKEGILIAVLVVLWIYIFQAFVYLPLIVRKMIKEHTFYALSEPSKLSLYHSSITETTPDSILIKPYSLIAGLYKTKNCCCIVTKSPIFLYCIPRKAFSVPREEETFEDFVWSALEEEKFWKR